MSIYCNTEFDFTIPEDIKIIEKSLHSTYKKTIFSPFIHAIKEFNLISENDKIAVCISGGKDSLVLAKCFQELQKHSDKPFELEFISMDPGYTESNKKLLLKNCEALNLNIKIKVSNYFSVVENIAKENPCYLCARMRRGFLYNFAQELGCNKIALAHHFDDVIETTLINVLYGGQYKTMVPKIKSLNFENMELIRPLVFVKEESIKKFVKRHNITTLNCGCTVAALKTASKRGEIKELLNTLKKNNHNIENSIFRSAYNVNVGACYGYIKSGVRYNFEDVFNDNALEGEQDE